MKNLDEVERWIKQGERDLEIAGKLLNSEMYEAVAFIPGRQQKKHLGVAIWKGVQINSNPFCKGII